MSGETIPSAQVGAVRAPRDRARVQQSVNAACAVGTVAWAAMTYGPVLGGAVAMAWAAQYLTRRRARTRWARAWLRDLGEVHRLITTGKIDEAEAALARREAIPTNSTGRAILAYFRGVVEWERGDLEAAVSGYTEHLRRMPRPVAPYAAHWWANLISLVHLQLELRRLHVADRSMALLREWRVDDAWQLAALEAHHARAHERADELGDEVQLHARARQAAARQDGGPTLANVAWAFEQRGDHDTAARLFAQVPALLQQQPPDYWRRHYPRMWAWLEPRLPPGA